VGKPFRYHFEWDPVKARRNVREHGITFERAATVLLDPQALSMFDEEHGLDEDRWITLGVDQTGILLVVCHTYGVEKQAMARIRLISARKASRSEAQQYLRK